MGVRRRFLGGCSAAGGYLGGQGSQTAGDAAVGEGRSLRDAIVSWANVFDRPLSVT